MALQAGQVFGNYRIVRLLGEGGFGEVYLAENPLLERRAAVKVLHTGLARDPELVRRFLNEARAASAIRHPNIIEVFDAGLTPERAPYILMEFLEGVSLQKRLAEKGRLGLDLVLDIARQAGSALGAAHAAGIVHRDLKPENVFLMPDPNLPGAVRVKILDFGIAKIKRSAASGGTLRTQAGLIMGSPAYMSPEQCKDSADVDLRSDIYSFGVIVYEALTGQPPFMAASATEILVMQLTATPAPLRERIANVPLHVEAAVMRALAKERNERFDTVASFVSALRGEGVATKVGTAGSPVVGTRAADSARSADSAAMAGAASVTTFSRATGEVGVSADDVVSPTVARRRRWPFVALGGLVGLGLAIFLLVRPSHGPTSREATSNAGVALPAAHPAAAPPPQQAAAPVPALPAVPDAGAAAAPSATAPPIGKPSSAAPTAAGAAAKPSPSGTERRHQVSKKKADDEWELH
ncbi:MAG: serine/threonine-protein kinase [Polyangia bacterium]